MLLTLRKFFFHPAFIFVILFSCIAGFSLLHPGLPPTHDGEYHVVRFYEFDKTLRSGDWYPRWAADLNNGYGVPLFNYVYPLPNYIASLFHLFGISFIDAFKLNMFFATLIGGVFFYLWTREFWGEIGGFVASVFYTYSPYHFVDIYIRGSVGEVWAMAFFPAFLWSLSAFLKERKSIFVVLSGIFLALIIFSHNILSLMFLPFALSYIGFMFYFAKEKKYLIRNILYIILFGLGLSAIFWLPALWERQYVTGLQIYDIKNNFPELYQLLIPSWGSGFSGQNAEDQMSFQIGIANLFAVIGAIIVFLKRKDKAHPKIIIFFLILFVLVFFLMLKISLPVWHRVPFMDYFQFPWRLLSLEIIFCSFLAGSITLLFQNKVFILFLILLPFVLDIGYAKSAYYHQRYDMYYISRSNFIDGTNSPGDLFNTIWFNRGFKKQNKKASVVNGEIISVTIRPTIYTLTLFQKSESSLTVNSAYFPGWEAFVDKKDVKIVPDRNGLISFLVSPGTHLIEVRFKDTPIRSIGVLVSLVTLLSMLFYPALKYRGIIPVV